MEAKGAWDLEGKKVADPLSLFPSSIPRFLLPSTPRYFSTKELALIAAPGRPVTCLPCQVMKINIEQKLSLTRTKWGVL